MSLKELVTPIENAVCMPVTEVQNQDFPASITGSLTRASICLPACLSDPDPGLAGHPLHPATA